MAPVTVKSSGTDSDPAARSLKNENEAIIPEFSEEKEAKDRSVEDDSQLFQETCDKIQKLFDQMLHVRKTGSKKNLGKINEMSALSREFLMHYMTLKKLNRLDKIRTKNFRETAQASRQKVDSFHLVLQNLLYEVFHLEKEVSKCLQFRSGDEDITLVPLDEFYQTAPPEISKPSDTQSNPHLQRLARLEFEKLQRQRLSNQQKTREDEKNELEARISAKKKQLAVLKPQLASILASTKSLQDYLGLPLDMERDQLIMSKYLPHPLFIIFSETRAYAKVFDENILVEITGDLNEAKLEFYANQKKKKAAAAAAFEAEDQDEDDVAGDLDDEEDKKKKKKSRSDGKSGGGNHGEEDVEKTRVRQLLSTHPLCVNVVIKLPTFGQVHLGFKFLTNLECVAVAVNLDIDKESNVMAADKDMLQPNNIFSHLLEDPDSGEVVPNPTFSYRLQKLRLDAFPTVALKEIGLPYLWAQTLAGLEFPKFDDDEILAAAELQDTAGIRPDETIAQTKISRIFSEIKDRFVARLALQRQLSMLEKVKMMTIELPIPVELNQLFPSRISSKLRAWAQVDLEQYMALTVAQHLKEGGAVSSTDFFYRLQINRDFQTGSNSAIASLIALVAVKPSYPFDMPVFCLNLHWNGEHNARNSERIRSLEFDVNTKFLSLLHDAQNDAKKASKGLHYNILTLQIQHLMASLDVLLESWSADHCQQNELKPDFQREKLFMQPVRGRRRAPPLRYQPDLQLYTQ